MEFDKYFERFKKIVISKRFRSDNCYQRPMFFDEFSFMFCRKWNSIFGQNIESVIDAPYPRLLTGTQNASECDGSAISIAFEFLRG